ncbi:MAG: AbfB domain-containing protein [Bacteroidales bacterium]|nr:AbfB domain-containing protein [Bacteroidales bacterium]
MKVKRVIGIAFFVLASLVFNSIPSFAWSAKEGLFMTSWSKNVDVNHPLPEYPRPQMVRPKWLNLNGLWEFSAAKDGDMVPIGKALSEQILVPFPVESPLSGLMRMEDKMWYRRTFTLPSDWEGQHVLLHFGAVDWRATVYINGKVIGTHQGGYGAFTFDITNSLKSGKNEVIVHVFDPTDVGTQPVGKQTKDPRGYWYTSNSGIWQTVWLEAVPSAYITNLETTPDLTNKRLLLKVNANGISGETVHAVVSASGTTVAAVVGEVGKEIRISIPNVHSWSPDDPFLYDLKVSLKKNGSVIDQVGSYFGMRSITVGKVNGIPRPLLNGKFVFMIGPLDQGFWPDGIYTAPTDEALRFDLEQEKKCGYNLVRKHIKVEPARWYYWADKLGILVMQDMPSMAPRGLNPDLSERKSFNPDKDAIKEFEAEFKEMMDQLRVFPSIIGWVEFNENWGRYAERSEVVRLADWIKAYDPSRLLIADTGRGGPSVAGDAYDWHVYPGPGSPPPLFSSNRIAGLGEFGGAGFVVKGHSWMPVDKDQDTQASYTAKYVDMIKGVKALMYSPGLSYAVFTQITDVERERNGLFTYDRMVFKGNMDEIRAAHQDLIDASQKNIKSFTASFQDDFRKGRIRWVDCGGKWNVVSGLFTPVSRGTSYSLAKTWFNNLSCSADVIPSTNGEAGLIFRVSDSRSKANMINGYYAAISEKNGVVLNYSDGKVSIPLKTVPFKIEAGKKYRLRVDAFEGVIRIFVNDMSVPVIELTDFRTLAGAAGVCVSNGHAGFSDFQIENPFIRVQHCRDDGFLSHDSRHEDLVKVDNNVNRKKDCLWQLRPGLADAKGLTFESAAQPGFYLRYKLGQLVFERDDKTPEFRKDATWIRKPGLADPLKTSYESYAHPGEYIRQQGGWSVLCKPCKSEVEKFDATFLEMP